MKKSVMVLVSVVFVAVLPFLIFSCGKGGSENSIAKEQEQGNAATGESAPNLQQDKQENTDPVQENLPVQEAKVVSGKGETISYPVSDFEDGKAKYYSFENNGVTIKYFILKSSDRTIRAAFDACDVCFKWKMGYAQEGDFMVCRRCGQKFLSTKVNEVKGGCNPAPLNRRIEGKKVVIDKKDILEGEFYFN
ncbi:MAG: hypothetical protein A2042_09135 [Candidatus Schekmanbacteria bacterium GWA2_38_11]|uniref:Membrane iron-sulfur containing protein FtrD-like domain-containing protein n=1 Tax=Candidatus Schekmanbacteria bacterium GWA2_38_11 TaxID=1817876 RepID=A0A1F7RLZ8_9BACT|nr:MAG: hypothetical protein A2042_09135 [Candidatus Schekmanbacteria bacterium GWA2_38_11]